MNRDAIERGRKEAPYAFLIPSRGNDPWTVQKLLDPLLAAGVELQRAREVFTADGIAYPPGTSVVLMAQPLRPYAKDLLEAQQYPDRRLYPGGPPEPPYDEAGWTLPLKMGIHVTAVAKPFDADLEPLTSAAAPKGELHDAAGARAVAFTPESNAATIAVNRLLKAGMEIAWSDGTIAARGVTLPRHSFVVTPGARGIEPVRKVIEELSLTAYGLKATVAGPALQAPRVGLYQPWGGSVDEGWTRWLFEQFELPFQTLHREDIKAGDLAARFDVVVLPSMSANEIRTGESSPQQAAPTLPPPYGGGLGAEGVANLVTFVRRHARGPRRRHRVRDRVARPAGQERAEGRQARGVLLPGLDPRGGSRSGPFRHGGARRDRQHLLPPEPGLRARAVVRRRAAGRAGGLRRDAAAPERLDSG
jgi:hypothetical protein